MNPYLTLRAVRAVHQVLVCAIFALSLFDREPFGASSMWFKWLLAAALVSLALLCKLEKITLRELPPAVIWPVCGAGLFVLYVLCQSDPIHHYPARQFTYRFIAYLSFFMVLIPLVRRPASAQRLVLFMSLAGLLVALIGIGYRFTGSWDFLGRNASDAAGSSFGFFYYENTYGAFGALLIPLTAGILFYRYARREIARSGTWGRSPHPLHGYLSSGVMFLTVALVIMGVGIIVTNARMSLLIVAALYSGVALLFLPARIKIAVIILMTLSAGVFVLLASSKLLQIILEGFQWERLLEAVQMRWETIRMNLELFMDKPWTGWGMGAYKYVAPQFMYVFAQDALFHIRERHHALGSLMDLFVEGGAVGALLLCLSAVAVPILALMAGYGDGSLYRRLMRWQSALALASFAPMLLSDSHLRVPAVVLLMLIQMAILASSSRPYIYDDEPDFGSTNNKAAGRRLVVPIYAAIGMCLLLMSVDLVQSHRMHTILNSRMTAEQRMSMLTRAEPLNPERWIEAYGLYFEKSVKSQDVESRDRWRAEAVAALQKAIDLAPTYAYYRFVMARTLYDQGDVSDAIEAFKRAIELAPLNLKYRVDLMLVYIYEASETQSILNRRRWNLEARKLYDGIKSDPRYPERGLQRLNQFMGHKMTGEQKQYFIDFMAIADRYNQELSI